MGKIASIYLLLENLCDEPCGWDTTNLRGRLLKPLQRLNKKKIKKISNELGSCSFSFLFFLPDKNIIYLKRR